jgi:hypothetical protein
MHDPFGKPLDLFPPLGFSKKLDSLKAAVSLYFASYNFVRIHGSLKVTPAMEAGITDHVWTIGELLSNPM